MQQLKIAICTDPPSIDPRKGADVVSSTIHFLLFDGLVHLEADSTISPAAAESYSVSDDQLTYLFHMRRSYWSDGSLVTAHDFERTWKDVLRPDFAALNAHLFYVIKNAQAAKSGTVSMDEVGVRAIDEETLEVVLEQQAPYFLSLISFCAFFPFKEGPTFISNGPFVLEKWDHDSQLTVKKNPLFWNQENIKLESIQVNVVPNEMTVLQMYEKGELDLIDTCLTSLPSDAIPTLIKRGNVEVKPIPATTICVFNTHIFPFNNQNIRKAFSYAVDRKSIVTNITQAGEEAALCAIPPVMKGKRRDFYKDNDVEVARIYLEKGMRELNISDLGELTYIYAASDRNQKMAQALQDQWRHVLNIEVKILGLDTKHLIGRLAQRDFMFGQTQWIAQYYDPYNILERFLSKDNKKNYGGWENPAYIDLMKASAYETNSEKRFEILENAETIFMDEMPVSPIFHWNMELLIKPYLKGIEIYKMGELDYRKVWIER